ncbi:hypothetical protein Tco_1543422, partial [Tanacetum coccineum]
LKEAAKFVRDFQSLTNEADEYLAKHKALELEIERLLRAVVSQDIMSILQNNSVIDTLNLQTELDHTKERILPSSSRPKLYDVAPLPKSTVIPKVGETNALSNQVTSNSIPSSQELKVMEKDNVIALGMFRIDSRNTSRENKFVPIHNIRASVWTNSITMSQPYVISKKAVNSDSNGFSSTGVDVTTKTRRPQPRSNTKNDRVPSTSQSSCIKNKEVEVEECQYRIISFHFYTNRYESIIRNHKKRDR